MPIYSHSRLSVYEGCPLQYKLRYIDKVERESVEGVEGFLGTAVHETLRKCYDDIKLSKLNSLTDLLSFFNNLWEKGWHDEIVIARKGMTEEDYKNHGRKLIEGYYARYTPFNSDITIKNEMRVGFSLDKNSKYRIQGYIDRLCRTKQGIYEIHDYKTSSSLPSQEDMDKDRQLALYQIGVQQKWKDAKDVRLVWHYLTFDKEMASIRSDEEINQLKQDTINLIDTIEAARDYPPRESMLCEWCEYPDLCPSRKHPYMVETMPANEFLSEPGVTLVNKYTELKADADKIGKEIEKVRNALAEYARKEGVSIIQGSSRYVRVKFDKKLTFPGKNEEERKELEEIIIDAGKWREVSTLDLAFLKRIIEEGRWDEDLVAKIMEYSRLEETSAVYLSRLKEEDAE